MRPGGEGKAMVLFEFALLLQRIRSALTRRRVAILVAMMGVVLVAGTVGMHEAQGLSYFDSFYWTVVTISTIGYGDIVPTTFWARILFFFVVFVGIGTFATALTEIAAYFMEQKLLQMRGLHRARMKQHAIIVGYDESTEELVRQLQDRDLESIVVDKDLDAAALHAKGIAAISGDPQASETLERAGIKTANALVLPSAGDEGAVMVALKAKQLNPGLRIVATCTRREDFDIMRQAHIDVVVPMSRLLGEVLAEAVNESTIVDFLLDVFEKEGGIDLDEVRVDRPTTVGGLALKAGEKPIVVYRHGVPTTDIRPDTPLAPGDLVIAIYAHPTGPQG
ncbi:MAG TPA: hypothetical protein HA326_04660 [Thermoplasmata archaeon]|nr:hypothetical protein [Thermoplasmata archaeon]